MAKPSKPKPAPKRRAKKTDRRGAPKLNDRKRPLEGHRGNPPFEPTEQQRREVMMGAAVAMTQQMMAERMGISVDTLQRHFRKELDEGLQYANAKIGGKLYEDALAGDAKKMEMWLDRRGGPEWRKKTGIEHTGANGGPMEYREIDDDELDARINERLAQRAARPSLH